MALYKKHLRNMDELRREQRALKKKQKQLSKEPLISLKQVTEDTEGLAGKGMSLLGNILSKQSGIAGIALPLVLSLLRAPAVKRTAGSAAKGLAGGFLKWKALTLGLRIAKSVLSKKKKDTDEKEKEGT